MKPTKARLAADLKVADKLADDLLDQCNEWDSLFRSLETEHAALRNEVLELLDELPQCGSCFQTALYVVGAYGLDRIYCEDCKPDSAELLAYGEVIQRLRQRLSRTPPAAYRGGSITHGPEDDDDTPRPAAAEGGSRD